MPQHDRSGKLTAIDRAVKTALVAALKKTGWQPHKAALLMGMNPPRMYRLARKFGLIKVITVTRKVRRLVKA